MWNSASAVDRVVLDSVDRHRRRGVFTGERGTTFLVDMPQPVLLKDGDGIVLDDGAMVLVAGELEALVEVAAPSPVGLVQLAWHLGNRHTDVQVVGDKLRIRHDHVLEEMVRGLGAHVAPVEAPFDPEGGQGLGHGA
jgi:urease accessory protein